MAKKIRCFKCNGSGTTGVSVSPLFVVATLGFGALADTEETCDACGGTGYLVEDEDE